MLHTLSGLLVAGMLTAFAVLLLTGHYVGEGPVLLRLGDDHGIHQGDVLVVLGWAAALASVTALLASRRRKG